jgi:hypothetical protein
MSPASISPASAMNEPASSVPASTPPSGDAPESFTALPASRSPASCPKPASALGPPPSRSSSFTGSIGPHPNISIATIATERMPPLAADGRSKQLGPDAALTKARHATAASRTRVSPTQPLRVPPRPAPTRSVGYVLTSGLHPPPLGLKGQPMAPRWPSADSFDAWLKCTTDWRCNPKPVKRATMPFRARPIRAGGRCQGNQSADQEDGSGAAG